MPPTCQRPGASAGEGPLLRRVAFRALVTELGREGLPGGVGRTPASRDLLGVSTRPGCWAQRGRIQSWVGPVSSRGHGRSFALDTSTSPQNRREARCCAEDPWKGPGVAAGEAVRLKVGCGRESTELGPRDRPTPETAGRSPAEPSVLTGPSVQPGGSGADAPASHTRSYQGGGTPR